MRLGKDGANEEKGEDEAKQCQEDVFHELKRDGAIRERVGKRDALTDGRALKVRGRAGERKPSLIFCFLPPLPCRQLLPGVTAAGGPHSQKEFLRGNAERQKKLWERMGSIVEALAGGVPTKVMKEVERR